MRPFTVHDVDQRSEAWRKLRAGRLTASCAAKMMATRKDKTEAAPRRDLRLQLACEILTGEPQDDPYQSNDMTRGIETEPEAFAAYELSTLTVVQRVGFITHNKLPIGCSPDGIVGDFEGGVELKCPRAATHLSYIRNGVPLDYEHQIVHSLLVTGLPWWDFASYCPQLPEPLRLFCARFERDDEDLQGYQLAVSLFMSEVEKEVTAVRALIPAGAVA